MKWHPEVSGITYSAIISKIIDNDDVEALNLLMDKFEVSSKIVSIIKALSFHGISRCVKERKLNLLNKIKPANYVDLYHHGMIVDKLKDLGVVEIFILLLGNHTECIFNLKSNMKIVQNSKKLLLKAISEGLAYSNAKSIICIKAYSKLLKIYRLYNAGFVPLSKAFIAANRFDGLQLLIKAKYIDLDKITKYNVLDRYHCIPLWKRYSQNTAREIFECSELYDWEILPRWDEHYESFIDIVICCHEEVIKKKLIEKPEIASDFSIFLFYRRDIHCLKYIQDNNMFGSGIDYYNLLLKLSDNLQCDNLHMWQLLNN
jgi:hypothetical protein